MKKHIYWLLTLFIFSGMLQAQEKAKYVPYVPDPVIKAMIERDKKLKEAPRQETAKIRERQQEEAQKGDFLAEIGGWLNSYKTKKLTLMHCTIIKCSIMQNIFVLKRHKSERYA